MNTGEEISLAMAKLAAHRNSLDELLTTHSPHGGQYFAFRATDVAPALRGLRHGLGVLRVALPSHYGDFVSIVPDSLPEEGSKGLIEREDVTRMASDIDRIFQIRAHVGLAVPTKAAVYSGPKVFLSHGRSEVWRELQAHLEKDAGYDTCELAQEPSMGQTVIEKLTSVSRECCYAVILMTGDDKTEDGQLRARENVLHEIGFFQGRYGRDKVCLLHEEGVNVPSNLGGIVYASFPKKYLSAAFTMLGKELSRADVPKRRAAV